MYRTVQFFFFYAYFFAKCYISVMYVTEIEEKGSFAPRSKVAGKLGGCQSRVIGQSDFVNRPHILSAIRPKGRRIKFVYLKIHDVEQIVYQSDISPAQLNYTASGHRGASRHILLSRIAQYLLISAIIKATRAKFHI